MKVVLVTGAARGLGRAVVARLLARGARVVALVRRDDDARELVAAHGAAAKLHTVVGDLTDPATAGRAVQAAVDAFGRLDAIVNNAGVLEPIARIADVDPAQWHALLAVNVVAPAQLVRAALPQLREHEGAVVNVSSGAAVNAYQGWGAYCCSKAALNMLTEVLAKEEPRVRFVAVRPGVVATDMQRTIREKGAAAMNPEQHAHFTGLHSRGALVEAELPADAIAALALACPLAWSGAFVTWNEDRVAALTAAPTGPP